MTGWWIASYAALWLVVLGVLALLAGVLQQLGRLQRGGGTRPLGALGASPEENGPPIGAKLAALISPAEDADGPSLLPPEGSPRRRLLLFMSATCVGCQRLVEPLNTLVRGGAPGLDVVVVLSGVDAATEAFLNLFPVEVPVKLDPNGDLSRKLLVSISPTALLFDTSGTLVRKDSLGDEADLASLVDQGEEVMNRPLAGAQ